MKLFDISISSIKKQIGKKIFLATAIILGCVTVIGMFSFVTLQKSKIETQFDEYGANILILPKSDNIALSYGGVGVSSVISDYKEIDFDSVEKIKWIKNSKNIRAVSPKVFASDAINNKEIQKEALIIGVNFQEELKIKSWWDLEGNVPKNENDIIIGSFVKEIFKLGIGDKILIKDKEFNITGIIELTGSQDDGVIFGNFNVISKLFGKKGKVSLVEVSALCGDCPIEEIVSQITDIMPDAKILEIKQVMRQKMESINQFEKFAIAITTIIAIFSSILIFSSMMGSVVEKKYEIGVFRAIGFRKIDVATIIIVESLIVTIIAAAIGIIIGILLSNIVITEIIGAKLREVFLYNTLVVGVFFSSIILSFSATLYPAIKASNIDPVIALRGI